MRNVLITLLAAVLLTSCVKEDYFGESEFARIKKIEVSNQSGNAVIDNETSTITVEIPGGVDLSQIRLESITLSTFAVSDKKVGDLLDLNDPAVINVTAEGGATQAWIITAFVASATPQPSNGDLNMWYQTPSNYYEPGESAETTIWGTGNRGTQILNKLATIPEDLGNGNLAAKMETLDNGVLASIAGTPISAGSVFTGVFNADDIDPADPEAAIAFGTPFTGRPNKVSFKYSYAPGEVNKNKSGTELEYSDACDIYALLEIRQGGTVERLGTAWFRSEDVQSDLTEMELEFSYGELDSSFPDYTKAEGTNFVGADSASYLIPTHLTFVASSSFDGAKFAGAVGSTLILDDVKFIY